MRDIKFRYTVKRSNGHVFSEIFPIKDIENGYVKSWFKNNHIGGDDEIFREQYTGLKDKNGLIEVYEGDIEKRGAVIKYSSMGNGCGPDEGTHEYAGFYRFKDSWGSLISRFDDIEIICNIHEPKAEKKEK